MAKESCHTCVYACWDMANALRNLASGFPNQPMCANQPEAPGLMRTTPVGNICRNYRAKPATPEGDVKRIPLAGGAYAYVDAADYEWLSQYSWHVYAGGYAARCEKGKTIYMHREIMKPPKGRVVDHADGNKGNNCRFNLRICTGTENRRNSAKHAKRSSRFKGVGYIAKRDKYWAKVWSNGRDIWLGYFDDEVEAARAYDHKAVQCSGPFARVNLPEEWPPERVQEVYARHQAALKRRGKKGGKSTKSAKGVKGKKGRTKEGKNRPGGKGRGRNGKRPGGKKTMPHARTRATGDGRRAPTGKKKARAREGKRQGIQSLGKRRR